MSAPVAVRWHGRGVGKMAHSLFVGALMRTIAVLLAACLGLSACAKHAVDTSTPVPATGAEGATAPASTFTARGNEPFWAVKAEGATLTYATPELQPGKVLQAQRREHARGVTFSGRDATGAFTLEIESRPCQDTMADESFAYTATFRYGGRILQGCASRGP